MTTTAWQHIKDLRRWEGWSGVARQVARKVSRPVVEVRRWFFFETDLRRDFPPATARVPVEIRAATSAELETFADVLRAAGIDPEKCQRRLARGDVAVVVLSGGQLAHVRWISYSSPVVIREIGVSLHLGPSEGYIYGSVTLPEWRGKGIADVPTGFTARYSLSRGVTRHVYYVRADNIQGLKPPARLHDKRTKTVWAVRIVGMKHRRLFGVTRTGSPSLARS